MCRTNFWRKKERGRRIIRNGANTMSPKLCLGDIIITSHLICLRYNAALRIPFSQNQSMMIKFTGIYLRSMLASGMIVLLLLVTLSAIAAKLKKKNSFFLFFIFQIPTSYKSLDTSYKS